MEQGQTNNQFAKHTIYILINRALSVLTTLVLLLYFSHHLSTEAFGALSSFWTQSSMTIAIAGLGLPIFVFTYKKEKLSQLLNHLDKRKRLIYIGWLALIGVFFAISQMMSNHLFERNVWNFIALAGFVAFGSAALLYEALSIVFGFFRKLLFASIFYNIIYLALFFLFYNDKIGSTGLGVALMFNSVLKYLVLEQQGFKAVSKDYIDIQIVKSNWLATGLYDLSQSVVKHLDKYLLSFLLAKELFGVYSLLTYEIPIFAIVFASLRSSTSIFLSSHQKDERHTRKFIRTVGKLLGFFIIPSVLFLAFFAKEVIAILFSDKYVAYAPFFIISVVKMLAYNFVFSAVLQYFEKVSIINKGVIIDFVISVVLAIPLYFLLGLEGIILSIVISTFVQIGYYTYHSKILLQSTWKQILPIRPWLMQLLFFGVLTGLVKLIAIGFDLGTWAQLTLGVLIIAPLALWLIYRTFKSLKSMG